MAKKQKNRLDFESMAPLTHNPLGALGPKLGPDLGTELPAREENLSCQPSEEPSPAANPILLVRLEKRAGSKVVTCIHHLQCDGKPLLKGLKKRLASGGTIQNGVMEIQGDHRKASAAFLEESGFRVRIAT